MASDLPPGWLSSITHEQIIRTTFGRELRRYRCICGLTQAELAAEAGMSRPSIVNIEQGRQGVSVFRAWQLADALGVRPATLLRQVWREASCG